MDLRQELRYAVRAIRRTPVASAVVVATLGIGIALVTTFYSLINTAFFRPLPFPNADRLIRVAPYPASQRAIIELATVTSSLERIGVYEESSNSILVVNDDALVVPAAGIDSSVLPMLGMRPVLGELPSARDMADRRDVLVIGERLWRTRFGGDSAIVGRAVKLDGQLRRIVAVMPQSFSFPARARAWYPLKRSESLEDRYGVIGQLRRGSAIDAVIRETRVVGDRLHKLDPKNYRRPGRTAGLSPMEDVVDRGRGRGPGTFMMVWFVIGPALCALLIACTNVAALMLARLSRRRGEFIVRATLGATRWQLVRQTLLESAMLATLAGVVGTVFSIWGVQLVLALLPQRSLEWIPGWANFGVDLKVLAFAVGVSLLTVLVFGLWPARAATRFDLAGGLKSSADHGYAGGDATRRLHLPVVLELTLAVMLFVGASVMGRSWLALSTVDRGYELKDRYHAGLTYEAAQDSIDEQYVRNVEAIRARAEELAPGIHVAASSQATHVRGDTTWVNAYSAGGKMLMASDLGSTPLSVSDNYFATLGIPILAGRTFGPTESGSAVAVIVSREFARYFWGDANPIGQSLRVTFSSRALATVVGVAGDVVHADRASGGALEPSKDIYFSMRQTMLGSGMTRLIVHSTAGPASVTAAIRTSLRSLGRQLPVEVMSLADEEASRGAIFMVRTMSAVLGTVAIAGFLLSMMGIYGVVAFAVEQRTREIGVRVALGATGNDVIAHMMKGGINLVGIGIGLGLLGALANGRILESMVVGTISTQIGTALAVAALFGAIALASCYLPARRAAAMDPLKALRSE